MVEYSDIDDRLKELLADMADKYPGFGSFMIDAISPYDDDEYSPMEKRLYITGLIKGYERGYRDAS